MRNRLKGGEYRATPGGYGGKPPGVAIIGVPTGARNAGSGAPTGDQSTDTNATRKLPPMCQDPITSRSQDSPGLPGCSSSRRWSGTRRAGAFEWYSMNPRTLVGSRPQFANTTATYGMKMAATA